MRINLIPCEERFFDMFDEAAAPPSLPFPHGRGRVGVGGPASSWPWSRSTIAWRSEVMS